MNDLVVIVSLHMNWCMYHATAVAEKRSPEVDIYRTTSVSEKKRTPEIDIYHATAVAEKRPPEKDIYYATAISEKCETDIYHATAVAEKRAST